MGLPTNYSPTSEIPIPYGTNTKYFVKNDGSTVYTGLTAFIESIDNYNYNYIVPLVTGFDQNLFIDTSWGFAIQGLTRSKNNIDTINALKLIPQDKRGLFPLIFQKWYHWQFFDDKMPAYENEGYTFWTNNFLVNLETTGYTQYTSSIWPDRGISTLGYLWDQCLELLYANGASLDAVIFDREGTLFDIDRKIKGFYNDPRGSTSWRGLSSWISLNESMGGNSVGQIEPFDYAVEVYETQADIDVYNNPLFSRYPNAIMANYDTTVSDPGIQRASPNWVGNMNRRAHYWGNAVSPENYSWMYLFPSQVKISYVDPTITTAFLTPDVSYSKQILRGPWPSFLMAVGKLRETKRNNPSLLQIPHIGPVSLWGDSFTVGTRNISGVTYTRYMLGPVIGFADIKLGYNPKTDVYLDGVTIGSYQYSIPGNSAYYYEMVRHSCLYGTKGFVMFNPSSYIDESLPGSTAIEYIWSGEKKDLYLKAGLTQHVQEQEIFENVMQEIHDKIGGFTMPSGDISRVRWDSSYISSGAPGLNGTTWYWRITVAPGFTLVFDGITLPNTQGNVGMWYETSGSTLAGIPFTATKWATPITTNEPSLPTPTKEFDFSTMSSLNDLINQGFTFSRSSVASYVNNSGIVQIAGTNQPRFTYNPQTNEFAGLLIEPSGTNLLNWSESFANTGGSNNNWLDSGLTRISSNNISPSGSTNAIRFKALSSNATILSSNAIGSTGFRILSCWMRGITGTENIEYTINNGISWESINVYPNVSMDATGLDQTWKRFIFGPRYTWGDDFNHQVGFRLKNQNEEIELWGIQLENSIQAAASWKINRHPSETSYIPSASTLGVRSPDICYITGTSFSSWFSGSTGTFIWEGENGGFYLSGNSVDPIRDSLYLYHDETIISYNSRTGNTAISTLQLGSSPRPYITTLLPINQKLKTALCYSPTQLTLAHFNDGKTGPTNSFGLPTLNIMYPAWKHSTGNTLSQYPSSVSRIRYWDQYFGLTSSIEITNKIKHINILNPYG